MVSLSTIPKSRQRNPGGQQDFSQRLLAEEAEGNGCFSEGISLMDLWMDLKLIEINSGWMWIIYDNIVDGCG